MRGIRGDGLRQRTGDHRAGGGLVARPPLYPGPPPRSRRNRDRRAVAARLRLSLLHGERHRRVHGVRRRARRGPAWPDRRRPERQQPRDRGRGHILATALRGALSGRSERPDLRGERRHRRDRAPRPLRGCAGGQRAAVAVDRPLSRPRRCGGAGGVRAAGSVARPAAERPILAGVGAPAATEGLLEGLNEPQREAVLHGEGPLLILAGAGSGKTRVLTHRIAHLVGTGQAAAGEILAITFTNKAAGEMRERVEMLVGRRARAMWVMTFHSACARMLRSDAERLGYTRGFTIYDEQDSLRLVKNCIEELDIDTKRFAPRGIRNQISEAKNALLDAAAYREKVSSFFEQTAADVYDLYEPRLHAANAMDFDDLLFRCVNLFELFPEVRDRYRRSFRHVLVDEYQDTNRAQYRWLQLLCEEHRNLFVVGDDDQCLAAGTPVTMADGTTKPIERIREGELVLSSYGSGD